MSEGGKKVNYLPSEVAASKTSPGKSESSAPRTLIIHNFAVGSETLKPEHVAALRAFAAKYRLADKHPRAWISSVEGCTDPVDTETVNRPLRRMRAERVVQELTACVDVGNVQQGALKETPEGSFLAPDNNSPETRSRNRAVRIVLSPIYVLIVVGSPDPEQAYPREFVNAAERHWKEQPGPAVKGDNQVIWLVEYTGYYMYERLSMGRRTGHYPLKYLKENYEARTEYNLGWITPKTSLLQWFQRLENLDGPVDRLFVYSHGVGGMVTLRYGWGGYGQPDYGLSRDDINGMKTDSQGIFTPKAQIEFDSCNTGASIARVSPLAQDIANRIHRPVRAATGRTSYEAVNRGAGGVRPSEWHGLNWDTAKELGDRALNLRWAPKWHVFEPENDGGIPAAKLK